MGNPLGNLLGLAIVVIIAVISLFSLAAGVLSFSIVAYGCWLILWVVDFATRPSRDGAISTLLTNSEFAAYSRYHTFIMFPGAGQAFSALLNLLRLAGIVWIGLAIWEGNWLFAGILVFYFFLVGGVCLRFDPVRYLLEAAQSGNDVARNELLSIESIQSKRSIFNATS